MVDTPRLAWIDTHCHLDAPEFDADRSEVIAAAQAAGVRQALMPAVHAAHFDAMAELARASGYAYALGIHPLFVARSADEDLERLREALAARAGDPRLVAVGEIGIDHFMPDTEGTPERARQQHFYLAQLKLAREAGLPVILHTRRSVDTVLAGLRRIEVPGGIAHAFNGSAQQAETLVALGFKIGFGGAMTFERALQIRERARTLPESALVLETDAPDIPPHWLYRTAQARAAGERARNTPAELPRIAETLAELRGWTLAQTAEITGANARAALPRLPAFVDLPALAVG